MDKSNLVEFLQNIAILVLVLHKVEIKEVVILLLDLQTTEDKHLVMQ